MAKVLPVVICCWLGICPVAFASTDSDLPPGKPSIASKERLAEILRTRTAPWVKGVRDIKLDVGVLILDPGGKLAINETVIKAKVDRALRSTGLNPVKAKVLPRLDLEVEAVSDDSYRWYACLVRLSLHDRAISCRNSDATAVANVWDMNSRIFVCPPSEVAEEITNRLDAYLKFFNSMYLTANPSIQPAAPPSTK